MSTTSMAIFSNPLFATYSVYARNASIVSDSVTCSLYMTEPTITSRNWSRGVWHALGFPNSKNLL